MMNPLEDQSRWTLGPCLCPECRLERDRKFRELLRECLPDANLTIRVERYTA